jgi:hypothetical protein
MAARKVDLEIVRNEGIGKRANPETMFPLL